MRRKHSRGTPQAVGQHDTLPHPSPGEEQKRPETANEPPPAFLTSLWKKPLNQLRHPAHPLGAIRLPRRPQDLPSFNTRIAAILQPVGRLSNAFLPTMFFYLIPGHSSCCMDTDSTGFRWESRRKVPGGGITPGIGKPSMKSKAAPDALSC